MVGQKRFDAKNVAQKTGRDGGNMCFWRYALVLAFSLAVAPMGQAQEATEEQAWIQIESYPSEATARARAEAYAAEFPDVTVFKGRSWHAIVLGPYSPEAAAGRLAELRRSGQVPGDAFVTDGGGFTGVLEDLAVAEAVEPEPIATEAPVSETVEPAAMAAETMAPESIEPAPLVIEPDETLREARASEAELSRDERMTLQEALKWYGFYASGIDGAFGQGTRASMSAWQEANGFEPTGVLTTRQRATLVTNHAADLAEFGFESVTEAEAGIEITLPLSLVTFDNYEPPFVHFAEKDGFYINLEGRVQKARRAVFGVGQAKVDYEIINEIAQKLKLNLGFANHDELLAKLDGEYKILAKIDKINNYPAESLKITNDNLKLNFGEEKLMAKNYDYYLTNAIARASRVLNKCSAENNVISERK